MFLLNKKETLFEWCFRATCSVVLQFLACKPLNSYVMEGNDPFTLGMSQL